MEPTDAIRAVNQAVRSREEVAAVIEVESGGGGRARSHSNSEFEATATLLAKSEDNNCNADQNNALITICRYQNRSKNSLADFQQFFIHDGPGVGKSYLAHKLRERFMQANLKVLCAAPTGVAASLLPGKRRRAILRELQFRFAVSIHRRILFCSSY
jgi:chromosomal replication initiation ATPase DnaA